MTEKETTINRKCRRCIAQGKQHRTCGGLENCDVWKKQQEKTMKSEVDLSRIWMDSR